MISSSRFFIAVVCSTSALAAGAQQRDSVTPRFDWPVGMRMLVEHEWERSKGGDGGPATTMVFSRNDLTVEAHPQGRVLRVTGFAVDSVKLPLDAPASPDAKVLSALGTLTPSTIVTEEGEFAGIVGAAQLVATMREFLGASLDSLALPPQARQMLDAALSEEMLTMQASESWESLAGLWLGKTWHIGDTLEAAAEVPFPLLPGTTMPMAYTFSASRRTACAPTHEAECVEFVMQARPDAEGMRRLIERVFEQLGVADDTGHLRTMFESLDVTIEVRMLSEPDGWRPHRLSREQRVSVTVSEGGITSSQQQLDRRITRYVYAR